MSTLAPRFWAAVEECLVTFHRVPRVEAAEQVKDLIRRLPTSSSQSDEFTNMIYHSEPWHVAANLANADPLAPPRREYEEILARNGLIESNWAQLAS